MWVFGYGSYGENGKDASRRGWSVGELKGYERSFTRLEIGLGSGWSIAVFDKELDPSGPIPRLVLP